MLRFYIEVGGIIFTTTEATLRKSPTLNTLIDTATLPENDILFVDRDPIAFTFILMYLRSGSMYTAREDDTYIEYLMSEASFYGLRKLEQDLADECIRRKTNKV